MNANKSIGIDVEAAVKTAIDFFRKSFGSVKLANVQLEEIDRSEDERSWLITIGYDNPTITEAVQGGLPLPRPVPTRKYGVVRVNALTGLPQSVKIRPSV